MKKAFLLLILGVFVAFSGSAQSKKFVITSKEAAQHIVPIFDVERVVVGYVLVNDAKAKGGKRAYSLTLLNLELETILEKEVVSTKGFALWEAVYNETHYGFRFQDIRERFFSSMISLYIVLDEVGEIVSSQKMNSIKLREPSNAYPHFNLPSINQTIYPVKNKGFLIYSTMVSGYDEPILVHAYTTIEFVSTENKTASWLYGLQGKSRTLTAGKIGIKGDTLLSTVYTKRLKETVETSVLALDLNTGDVIYQRDISKEDKSILSLNFQPSLPHNELAYYGRTYPRRNKPTSTFYFSDISIEGEQANEREIPINMINGILHPAKVKILNQFFIHHIIRTTSDETYMIIENREGLITLGDIYIFVLDPYFKIKEVKKIEKPPHSLAVKDYSPRFITNLGDWNQSNIYKIFNFTYAFTQKTPDNSQLEIAYFYDQEKTKHRFGYLNIQNSEFKDGFIDVKTKAEDVFILPAPLGKSLVVQYFDLGKEQKLKIDMLEIKY